MTTEPKLLTEADFNRVWALRDSPVELRAFLRERGLIAEEPVDRLMKKAVELVGLWLPDETELRHEAIDLALAALRCGMELAPRKELTREMVDKGESLAGRLCDWSRDGEKPVPLMQEAAAYIRALTEALQ